MTTLKLVPIEPSNESPFDALVRAAERDPQAAEGLALAYAQLSRDERVALIETIVSDARAAKRSPAGTLALLLGVEDDPELACRITFGLMGSGSTSLAQPDADAGWAWKSASGGGIAVARHLHGEFLEVIAVTWAEGTPFVLRAEPLATHERLSDVCARLGVPESADALRLDEAIDRLAEVLWRAHKEGPLPEALRDLADLFEPY